MTASVPMAFENIEYLLGVIPVIVIGWVLIHKGARRSLILSRIIIVSLLVVALAGPYNPVTVTETDETPTITVLSDETDSMDIFESGTAEEIFDKLQDTTPARMEKMGGLRSDIGDEILASSTGDDHIIVVSDGNNNFGSDLAETIDFVSDTGTVVYAVTQTPEKNDLSVEITGARTAVLGNENTWGVEIRETGMGADCKLNILVDGETKETRTINKFHDMKAESFQHTFYKLGPHVVTAEIISGNDRPDNNVFNKTIYVVPKPRILLITLDADSSLHQILKSQYNLDTASVLEANNLSDYKAVVLDNLNEGRISATAVKDLREYTAGGGGLLVVGGDNSYDKGDYLNSSFEAILPVESYSSIYKGSINVVLILDMSNSVVIPHDVKTDYDEENKTLITKKENILQYELGIALDLLSNMGSDSNIGLVTFGKKGKTLTDGMIALSRANRELLQTEITNLNGSFGIDNTSYYNGLEIADKLLENESGEKNVILLSDGGFHGSDSEIQNTYELTRLKATDMVNRGIKIFFVQILTDDPHNYFKPLVTDIYGNTHVYYKLVKKGGGLDLKLSQDIPEIPSDDSESFVLLRLDDEHFITRYLNISGSISGYNDVTQKVGARRLVTTSMGKPVVTTWEFGLGRVVSLSSDNGYQWAGALYSGENARLLPSMVNWAVGDPRPEGGIVVYSGDMNLGSPGTVIIRSNEMPAVVFGKQEVPVSQTGERTYEGVIEPEHIGLFNLEVSAGGVTLEDTAAVNYPLEYRDVGNDPDFLEAVKHSGGGVYNVDQARSLLFSDIRKNSIMISEEHVSLSWLFLITALLVFLGEVIMRRAKGIIEIKTRRKGRGR
ncbi:MAG: von Willebrand factor type A domain-containing protein [Candidatus Methanocomedens sp.]|nr:MAG: von Willebrand factor type A domain-containing protein [ANME-2 cluster archaeon]